MSESIARQWLSESSDTANNKQFKAHMNLISERISLRGLPGYENINYEAWYKQCEDEFSNNVLKSVRYDGFKMETDTESRIIFKTFETVEAHDGKINRHGIEVLLEKEGDGVWRLVQERILSEDESRENGLI